MKVKYIEQQISFEFTNLGDDVVEILHIEMGPVRDQEGCLMRLLVRIKD